METRKAFKEDARADASVRLVVVSVALVALVIGGFQNAVPMVIELWVGLPILAFAAYLTYQLVRTSPATSQHRSESHFAGTATSPVEVQAILPFVVAGERSSAAIEQGLIRLDQVQLENFCATLLRAEGNLVERTVADHRQGGEDLICGNGQRLLMVQCKHGNSEMAQEKAIRALLESMSEANISSGALFSLTGWTQGALSLAIHHRIQLVDAACLASRARDVLSDDDLNALLVPVGTSKHRQAA